MTNPSGSSKQSLPAVPARSPRPSPVDQRTDWVAAALRGRVRQGAVVPEAAEAGSRRSFGKDEMPTA